MRAGAAAVPVTLLTGFLGAGKTTLLNRLLPHPAMGRAAVLINEFGEVGIDHLIVEAVAADCLTLTTGCLCCAARGDLVTALEDLLGRRDAGGARFDRIVIEATGLADPAPIRDALADAPGLPGRAGLDTILTVVDGVDGLAMLARTPEARRQVGLADALLLSKLDRAEDPAAVARLGDRLAALNPLAPLLDGRDTVAVVRALVEGVPFGAARPPAGEPHHHHHGHADAVVLRAGTVPENRLEAFLALLAARHGDQLLRLKGLVATQDDPSRPHLVEAVGRRLQPGRRLARWPDADRGTRLVVILDRGPSEPILDLWAGFFGPPAPDRPDAEALMAGIWARDGLF